MREHREERELMRDWGKEGVRACSCARGRQLVTERGPATERKEHLREEGAQQPASRWWEGGDAERGTGRDAQLGKGDAEQGLSWDRREGEHWGPAGISGLQAHAGITE